MATRSIIKGLIHQYFDLMDKAKELTAETSERWQELVSEVEAERKAAKDTERTVSSSIVSEAGQHAAGSPPEQSAPPAEAPDEPPAQHPDAGGQA